MTEFHDRLSKKIQLELQTVDLEGCNISIKESVRMIKYLEDRLCELRGYFLALTSLTVQEEIFFSRKKSPKC